MNCPACDGKEMINQEMEHNGYNLYRCLDCELVCWQPMESPPTDLYKAETTEFSALRPVYTPNTGFKRFLRDMPARRGRLLDIGCNAGDFCFLAQKAGYSVTGIDISPGFIELTRQRFPSLDLEVGTLQEFVDRRPGEKYDVVTFFQLLEHLDNVRDFLGSVKTVLKPGGYVVCAVPNRDRWRFFSRLLREEWDYAPHHFTWWNSNCLEQLFQSFGFSVLSIKIDRITPFDCAFLVSQRLQSVAGRLGRRLLSGAIGPSVPSSKPEHAKAPPTVAFAYRLYLNVLPWLSGIVTSPLVPFLRKGGRDIYLLARLET